MLVVSSLINGLSNHDQISDLQMRLRALPKDLNLLYEEMVLKVDGIYAQEASLLYQLVAEATPQPGDWKPARSLSIYTLSLAIKQDLDVAAEMDKPSPDERTVLEQTKRMDILLKTRCGGLLEVEYGKLGVADLSPKMKVSYLHRTVRDFLEDRKTRNVLLKQTGGSDKNAFKPAVAIFKATTLQIKHFDKLAVAWNSMVNQGLSFARRLETDKRLSPTDLVNYFDTFDRAAQFDSMIRIAIQCSLKQYLRIKVQESPSIMVQSTHLSRPALDFALVPTADQENFLDGKMVAFLLNIGARKGRGRVGFI